MLSRAFLWDDRHVYEIHAVWTGASDIGVIIEIYRLTKL